jgi:uncharacterized delta-60 repeat protein
MSENLSTGQAVLSLASVRLGLPLALGVLAVLLLVSLVSAVSAPSAQASPPAPGDLDTGFGAGGVVTTPIGPGADWAIGIAIQSDGMIVVAGYAHNGSDYDFALARYTASGALDTTFGSGGVVTTPIGPGDDYGSSVAVQSDGKIVVAGYAHNGSDYDFALVRYTVSGTLDAAFGAAGVVTTPIGPGADRARGVAIQADGKIVLAGYAHNGGDYDFAVVRYTVSGTLDTSFGAGGVVTTSIGTGNAGAQSIAIQPGGGIVAAGYAQKSVADSDFALARYTAAGTLDTSFGSGGVVTTPIGPGGDLIYSVAIQPDGKIVAAGFAQEGSDYDPALARYTVSGTLDTAFGVSGVVTTSINDSRARGVAIQNDGRIVVAGWAHSGSDYDFAVMRYTVSGTLDTSFGTTGVVTTPIGSGSDAAQCVAIQPDGKIVAAGRAHSGSDYDFAVVRYHRYAIHLYLPLVVRNY